jgi:hypothetical protein
MQTSLVFIYHFQINYIEETFDLDKPIEGIKFSREIYNIPLVINELSCGEHAKRQLAKLKKKVHQKDYGGFTSRSQTQSQTSAPAGSGRGNTMGTVYKDPSIVYQLSRAGYELTHEIKLPGWSVLNPVCLL